MTQVTTTRAERPAPLSSMAHDYGTRIRVSPYEIPAHAPGGPGRAALERLPTPLVEAMWALHAGFALELARGRDRDGRGASYVEATFSLEVDEGDPDDEPCTQVEEVVGERGDALRQWDLTPHEGWIASSGGGDDHLLSAEGLAVAEALFGPVTRPTVVALGDLTLAVRHPRGWAGPRLPLPEAPFVEPAGDWDAGVA